MRTIILIPVIAALWAGCGTTHEVPKEQGASSGQDDLHTYEAEFRPSDHDPDPAAPNTKQSIDEPRARPTPGDTTSAADDELIQGYRVQMYSSTDIDAAKARKAEAEAFFPNEWFYLQYDPPTYKIRGGNFRQRYEADRFAKLATERGFAGSWTVPEKVFKHPPPPTR